MKLTEDEILNQLGTVEDWVREDKRIRRRFKFPSFAQAMQFVNQVADYAEQATHHPFIAIDFKAVTLQLTSWHAGGLTDADFLEARACDELFKQMTQH